MLMYFFIHWSWLVFIVVVVFDVVNLAQAWVIWEEEFPLLRKSLHKTGLWVSLWGVSWFMVAMGRPGQHTVGVATPGQVVWSVSGSRMRQAMRSKPASSAAPTSWLQTPPVLSFCSDFLWWWAVMWNWNKPFISKFLLVLESSPSNRNRTQAAFLCWQTPAWLLPLTQCEYSCHEHWWASICCVDLKPSWLTPTRSPADWLSVSAMSMPTVG